MLKPHVVTYEKSYDVFLSHSQKDDVVVRDLAQRLKEDGLRVWFHGLAPLDGEHDEYQILQALQKSHALILCMSANCFAKTEWGALERQTLLFRDPADSRRRFIPLRLDSTRIKPSLKQFTSIDWRKRSPDEYERLLQACRGGENDRTDPDKVVNVATLLFGQQPDVLCLALSGDGRMAVSGSTDKVVRVWEVETNRPLAAFEGHRDRILGVALSADGSVALSGSADCSLRAWNVETGRCFLQESLSSWYGVLGVALSADGKIALSTDNSNNAIAVWDLESGGPYKTLEGHTDLVTCVALRKDGRIALSGSADRTVRVWDVETGNCLAALEGHSYKISCLAMNIDGTRAVSGSEDHTLRVWDLTRHECISTLSSHPNQRWGYNVLGVALSANGEMVISAHEDHQLRTWNPDTGECLDVLERHTQSVSCVALNADGSLALSGSKDKMALAWDVKTRESRVALSGHTAPLSCICLSEDGNLGVSGSEDQTLRIFDAATGDHLGRLEGHEASVLSVALSRDGRVAISGSEDKTVRVWDAKTGACLAVLKGHSGSVISVGLDDEGKFAISGSTDHSVRIWKIETGECVSKLEGHSGPVLCVALTEDSRTAISGSADNMVRIWDVEASSCLSALKGHTKDVWSVAISFDGQIALSGSADKTVRVWDVEKGRCRTTVEGHTAGVLGVALSRDCRDALSVSQDQMVRLWDVGSGQCRAEIKSDHDSRLRPISSWEDSYQLQLKAASLNAATLQALCLSTSGVARLLSLKRTEESKAIASSFDPRYTNAKIVLVGESGAGKTGLAMRLCEDRWEPTESTHGMLIYQLKLSFDMKRTDLDREVWLWDFAGQPDYRLIHQLYMDEAAMGVFVFDPQDDNPFEDLGHWEKALRTVSKGRASRLLVAARCDRGGITISRKRFDAFCEEHSFARFLSTSAKTGEGCEDLKEAIAENISWDHLPWIATTRLFRLLKDALLKLKEQDTPLARMAELRQRLQLLLPGETFSIDELRAVIGLMQGQGVVSMLDFGDFVLLQPEQINRYGSVVIRMAREHLDEMGVVPEERVLEGRLDYKEMQRLAEPDEKILLRAMVQTFLDRSLCLREQTPAGVMLVFPSYFRRERPELPEYPNVFVIYGFAGPLDEIYSTLVVKLSYSEGFQKDQLWRNAADFKTPANKRVGLAMRKTSEGNAELVVYFEPGVPDDTKVTFIKYVHEHLLARGQDVTRVRAYVCPSCDSPLENRKAIGVRLSKGFTDIVCPACEARIMLLDLIEEKFASDEFRQRVRDLDERAQINLDNESRELILIGHAFAITGEAGQIFRPTPNSDWGIDGEIEFKNDNGKASGKRLYLQLKSGDSYLHRRKVDEAEIFQIRNEHWADYWQAQQYPVMLVIRTSDGSIRWMNVTEYLKREHEIQKKRIRQIVFAGEPFTALNLRRLRERILTPLTARSSVVTL